MLLDDAEAVAAYLTDILAQDDPRSLAVALGAIVRARGIETTAHSVDVSPEELATALSESGELDAATLLAVVRTIGVRLTVIPVPVNQPTQRTWQ